MKSARERMDIVAAFEQVGTFRGAAALCGTTHKTVKRVVLEHQAGESPERPRRPVAAKNTECV
ncbi:MAG: IS21 family transposase, partial [Acidimicrobiia bacterium]